MPPITILGEQPLPLGRAARLIPSLRGNRPVAPTTLYRWAKDGIRSRSGKTVRLETWRIGGSTVTSEPALDRFFRALSETGDGPASAADSDERHRQIEEELDRLGIA